MEPVYLKAPTKITAVTVTATMGSDRRSPKSFARQRSFTSTNLLVARYFLFFLATFVLLLVLLQIQVLRRHPLPTSPSIRSWSLLRELDKFVGSNNGSDDDPECSRRLENATARLRDMVTFLPLKDLRFASTAMSGHTWFMSSMNDILAPDVAEHLHFPSEASKGRLLCIAGSSRSNGSHNSYALAWRDSLPTGATLLGGLTFVCDTYYDFGNIWHGLSAVFPFVGWHLWRGCARPARWVLFHWGEVRPFMGVWVRSVMEAALGREVVVETLDGHSSGGRTTCFEEAVVFRHNVGSIQREKREEIFDAMRCGARKQCNVTVTNDPSAIRMTLFLRTGTRSFRNESATIEVFRKECAKVDGCRIAVVRPNNLTFCDQVRVMSSTDLLVSQHGAQLTNMIFMDKNSSVMEFFPKGWLELAGVGQYVYHWAAAWSGMRHRGAYRDRLEDPEGVKCPYQAKDPRCFTLYKDGQIGHNESYFASWTSKVLKDVREYKLQAAKAEPVAAGGGVCPCE